MLLLRMGLGLRFVGEGDGDDGGAFGGRVVTGWMLVGVDSLTAFRWC